MRLKIPVIFITTFTAGILLAHSASAKTFYLDGNLSSNCMSGNYSIANRDCSGSDGDAYNTLADIVTNLAGGDTLHIRPGTYIRTTNDHATGSLSIGVSGTSGSHTIITTLPGEERQAIICTKTGKCQYNPDPTAIIKHLVFTSGGAYQVQVGDTITGAISGKTAIVENVALSGGSWAGGDAAGTLAIKNPSGAFQAETLNIGANTDVASIAGNYANVTCYNPPPTGEFEVGGAACYYPNPAIGIFGNYVDVLNVKTYGEVLIGGIHDSTVQNCDIGGGGPHLNQGSAVMVDTDGVAYNITVKNNKIHNSAYGENGGFGFICYNASGIIENNEFYDGDSGDVLIKDTGGQDGRSWEIRNNFMRASSFRPSGNTGYSGILQDSHNIAGVYIHNNVFFQKSIGVSLMGLGTQGEMIAYNNTFIDNNYDLYSWQNDLIAKAYNNLQYHSNSSAYYDYHEGGTTPINLDSDYNMFYQTGTGNKWRRATLNTTTFSAWQGAGFDADSVNGSSPNFINASGTTPTDFKRSSYTENFTGSSYGIHAGAYETGNETIGIDWTTPADVTPPASPTGLSVN